MSSDDEVIISDDSSNYQDSLTDTTRRKRKSVPSNNVTLNETDSDENVSAANESDDDEIVESDEEGANVADESVIQPKRKNRHLVVSSSESENEEESDDEDDVERVALSPRSRMSITGIRPADMSDDSSEIEYSDDEEKTEEHTINSASSQNYESAINDSSEPTKMNSFIENSASEENSDKKDEREEESEDEDSATNDSPNTSMNFGSPSNIPRYSTHFAQNIKEKLSSTIYQPSTETIDESNSNSNSNATGNSSGSDLFIISNQKEKTIELLSSSDDEKTHRNAPSLIEESMKVKKSPPRNQFVQPKINHLPPPKLPKTPKAQPKKLVSQDFYRKEIFKLDEITLELQNAVKLVEKIGHNLPDGGAQLKLRCERLKTDMEIKKKYIASLQVEDMPGSSSAQNEQMNQKKPFFNQNAPNWDELSAAVNQIQPTHTGTKGLQTFNTQKALTVDRLKEMHSSLEKRPTEDVLADDPEGLKVTLMGHQKHALAWMAWREKQKPRGGILADDMGLGKTLTMISMVLASKNREDTENEDPQDEESDSEDEEKKQNQGWSAKGRRDYYNGGTLVVCPASLIRQWESEVETKVKRNRLTVCVHHGNKREGKPKHLRTYDIVVTTYNIVAREHRTNGTIFGVKWNRIILDEAHVVRNHKSQSSLAVCDLKGRFRWALTGTPIQNKETDVYALMKFLKCSPFDDLAHWKKWIDNKSAGGQMRLNTLMQSLMLRRTKALLQTKGELTCLPQKEIKLIEVNLDKDEMNVYQKIMIYSRTLFAQFLMQRADKNTEMDYREASNKPTFMQTKDPNGAYYKMHKKFTKMYHGSKEQVKSHEILVLLLRLRQICCHPGLIDAMLEDVDAQLHDSESDESQPEIDLLEQLNKLAIKDNGDGISDGSIEDSLDETAMRPEEQVMAKASARVLQRSNPVFDLSRPSTKMVKVLKTLKKNVFNTDDKAIIVSQWTSVLNILKTHLEQQGVQTLSLNGQIPVKNRQDIVTEFNNPGSNKRVLLLSLTAGGVGLNLVGANHLLLIDLHWNPQLEAQAQDRIYRVGQKKNVVIYKFMCKETVEERIKALQDHKMEIANGVLTGAKATEGSKLTIDDLKGLFGM